MAGGDLKALRDRLRAARGPDRELDTAIGEALNVPGNGRPGIDVGSVFWVAPPLTASVDLALALCERKLPRWSINLTLSEGYKYPCVVMGRSYPTNATVAVEGATAPLTILLALLEAMIGKETGDG